jgi:hypothetical protein
MSLLDRLIEFVASWGGGDDLGSFKAGQPQVPQLYMSWGYYSQIASSVATNGLAQM